MILIISFGVGFEVKEAGAIVASQYFGVIIIALTIISLNIAGCYLKHWFKYFLYVASVLLFVSWAFIVHVSIHGFNYH